MFITLAQAKLHCRIDDTDGDADLTLKISAAERAASEYIQCEIYLTQSALSSAISQSGGMLENAKSDYLEAMAEAALITDAELCAIEQEYALKVYDKAKYAVDSIRNGVVINEKIMNAMLLFVEGAIDIDQRDKCTQAAHRLLWENVSYA